MRTPGGVFTDYAPASREREPATRTALGFMPFHNRQRKKNMVGTKEFYDLMEMFEKNIKRIYIPGTNSLNKEPKELWKLGRIYADGNVNSAFQAYMHGYSFGKTQCQ